MKISEKLLFITEFFMLCVWATQESKYANGNFFFLLLSIFADFTVYLKFKVIFEAGVTISNNYFRQVLYIKCNSKYS